MRVLRELSASFSDSGESNMLRNGKIVKMERAEFDQFADEYYQQHQQNIAVTGETPEYFSEYKIADLAAIVRARGGSGRRVVDFGSGIGNSIPYFRKHMPDAELICADVSQRSIDLAHQRYPGGERYALIEGMALPIADGHADVVFSACVFHHIPEDQHQHWLEELRRVCRPGGLLVVFEHNPLNPLTVRAVNTCPFDVNAKLIGARAFRRVVQAAGWTDAKIGYRIFFPRALARLRPLEAMLHRVMLGAQYRVAATRP